MQQKTRASAHLVALDERPQLPQLVLLGKFGELLGFEHQLLAPLLGRCDASEKMEKCPTHDTLRVKLGAVDTFVILDDTFLLQSEFFLLHVEFEALPLATRLGHLHEATCCPLLAARFSKKTDFFGALAS